MSAEPERSRLFTRTTGPFNTVLNWNGAPIEEFSFYARSFHKAANTLVKEWPLDETARTDWDACPVVFLYRHAVELYLKGILVGPGANFVKPRPDPAEVCKDHSLKRLLPTVRAAFEAVKWAKDFDSEYVKDFDHLQALLEELESLDPNSFAFRYPVKKKTLEGSVPRHTTFQVREFARVMDAVLDILETGHFALTAIWSAMGDSLSDMQWNAPGADWY